MDLYEFEGKRIFKKAGLSAPKGFLVSSLDEAKQKLAKIGNRGVLKAQVLSGGRGKAGGVLKVDSQNLPERWLKIQDYLKIQTTALPHVLLEELIDVKEEFYLAITLNQKRQDFVAIFSNEGGVDIEQVEKKKLKIYNLKKRPEKIPKALWGKLKGIFIHFELILLEINPLAITKSGDYVLLDAKLRVDNDALFRQQDNLKNIVKERDFDKNDTDFVYVELAGNVGVIGNGAGLTMATVDWVKAQDQKPACFLDIGGGADPARVEAALVKAWSNPRVKKVFINIFAGITRADEVAQGIVDFLSKTDNEKYRTKIEVRLAGTASRAGQDILAKAKVVVLNDII